MLCLALDCGGTKTAFLLSDAQGNILGESTLPTAPQTEEGFTAMCREAADAMFAQAGCGSYDQVGFIAGGILGFGEVPVWEATCFKVLHTLFPAAEVFLENDVVIGIFGSLGMESGIHVISGTGSIGFGINNVTGESGRTGGWADFSDEGSCGWLGNQTLECFFRQYDGRLPRGPLYDIFVEEFDLQEPIDLNMLGIFHARYERKRREIARLQLLLLKAYRAGDPAAIALYDRAAWFLAEMARGVYDQLKMTGTVPMSYSGGLFNTGDVILNPLRKYLTERPIDLRDPLLDPVHGALLKAITMAGTPREDALQRLLQQV